MGHIELWFDTLIYSSNLAEIRYLRSILIASCNLGFGHILIRSFFPKNMLKDYKKNKNYKVKIGCGPNMSCIFKFNQGGHLRRGSSCFVVPLKLIAIFISKLP